MIKKKIFALLVLISIAGVSNAGEIITISASTRHLVSKGKSVDAIDGDWILKNDKVIAVIGQASQGREANMRVQSVQGAVIDFTSLADNNDYLAAFYPQGFPQADSRRNPAMFAHKIEVVKRTGTVIVLRAVRNVTPGSPYQSVTEYELRDGESFLRIKTIYTNTGTSAVPLPFSDKLRMDMDIIDATPTGPGKLAFLYNKWFHAAYGLYCEKGLYIPQKPVTGSDPGTGLLVAYENDKSIHGDSLELAPGGRLETVRYLLYGKDVAALQKTAAGFDKEKKPNAVLKVTDSNKKQLADVFLEVYNPEGKIVSFAISDKNGNASIPLANGTYTLKASRIGHDTVNTEWSVSDKTLSIIMKPLTSLIFNITEAGTKQPLPVKLEFKGQNGTPDPFLGISKRAEGADNFYFALSSKEDFEVPIAPGSYIVKLSHGPEYEVVSREVTVASGQTLKLDMDIKRLFESPKWVIADFHNHSTISGDNDTETRSRIINIAGAGIEFAPATEHNRICSYTDEINRLGLQNYVSSAAGIELTGPTGVASGPNHQNAFPLTVMEGSQGGGFPGISADLYTQMMGIYEYDNRKPKYIQHNHPGMGLPQLYFDKNQDGTIDSGFGTRSITDAIELQTFISKILDVTADDTADKKTPVFYWLQMLNQGDRIFSTTTSDSHNVGESTGSRFVYVYSSNDKPSAINADEIMASAKKGRMVMSNGPFLRADINGYMPGDDITAPKDSSLMMNIEVSANNEIQINRVQVIVNGRQEKDYNFTPATHPQLFENKVLQFKHSFPLLLKTDAHIIVVATGTKGKQDEVISRSRRFQAPIAVTNPFFIDVDGKGFQANKDTLGEPLPISRKRGNEDANNN